MNVSTKRAGWYRQLVLTVCALVFLGGASYAQVSKVTGKVVDQNGEPLIAVTVLVQGTTNGTSTDVNGMYSLSNVPAKGHLEFSAMGYATQVLPVNSRTKIDVKMAEDAIKLEDAVVTAEFGVKRVARSVGAAVQNLKGSEIAESGRDNFVSALQGRVAGISVTSSGGTPGSSTSIIIRGATSISGNNQPLYVIDGIPMNNSTFSPQTDFANADDIGDRNLDFSSRGNDINPEDIESMTVLKGAAAAALYGSDASNGAIIITTKKGQKGRGRIRYNNSFRFEKAYQYPEVQNKYDNGLYGSTMYYSKNRWGGRYVEGEKLYNNVKNMFQTGFTHRHNISMEGGTDDLTVRANASFMDQSGIVPTTEYRRTNLSLSGTANLTKWARMEASMQYVNTKNRKVAKGSGGALDYALRWPITDDMRKYLTDDGQLRFPDKYRDMDVFNPYFALYKNMNKDISDRFISAFTVNITPLKDWYIRGQMGWDVGLQTFKVVHHPDWATNRDGLGTYNEAKSQFSDPTLNIITGYKLDVKKFSFSIQAGYNQQENSVSNLSVYGDDFMVRDFQGINNCNKDSYNTKTTNTKRRVQAVLGSFEASYNNMAFVTFRARNDWSSTLPVKNNSYFYPAADFSFIFSELPFMKTISNTVNYLKLRGSIAQVGKDARPLSIYPALDVSLRSGGGYEYGWTGPNEKLKPEMNTSWEVGLEGRFLNNRLNLDFAYYSTESENQIVNGFRASYVPGFVLYNLNVGTFETSGIELRVTGDVIKSSEWTWNIGLNLSKNWSEVTYLPPSVTEYYNAYTWVSGNIRNGIATGHPITSLTGNDYQRNDKGQVLIDPSSGLPLVDSEVWSILGDREPKLRFGITTDVMWKGFTLSALLDGRIGATVVNGTKRSMLGNGSSWESVHQRETLNGVIFNGVLKDGNQNTANPTPNNISVNYSVLNGYSGGDADWVEKDINYVRVQEIRLNYRLPRKWLEKHTGKLISDASVFVAGNDLWTWTNYSGIDVVGNSNSAALGGVGGVGFDMLSIAAPRAIMFGLSVTF